LTLIEEGRVGKGLIVEGAVFEKDQFGSGEKSKQFYIFLEWGDKVKESPWIEKSRGKF
jgi:hypothetical protein